VATAEECQKGCDDEGYTFSGTLSFGPGNWGPPGCLYANVAKTCYFNTHPTGGAATLPTRRTPFCCWSTGSVSEPTPDPEPTPETTPDPEPTPEPTPDPEPTPEPTPDPTCRTDDQCLQQSWGWGPTYTCAASTVWCTSWGKDMHRCCPDACAVERVCNVEDCNLAGRFGTCDNFQCGPGGSGCNSMTPTPEPEPPKRPYPESETCVSFVEGDENTKECDAGSSAGSTAVATAEECKKGAEAEGYSFSGSWSIELGELAPPGCFVAVVANTVYFNPHPVGGAATLPVRRAPFCCWATAPVPTP